MARQEGRLKNAPRPRARRGIQMLGLQFHGAVVEWSKARSCNLRLSSRVRIPPAPPSSCAAPNRAPAPGAPPRRGCRPAVAAPAKRDPVPGDPLTGALLRAALPECRRGPYAGAGRPRTTFPSGPWARRTGASGLRIRRPATSRGGEAVKSPGSYPGDRGFKSSLRNHFC